MKRTHFTMGILAALAALTMSTCSDAFLGKGNPVDPASPNYEGTPTCLLYTSPSPRDRTRSRMPSSA